MTGGFPSQLLSAVNAAKSTITQAVHVQLVDAIGNIISIHDGHLKTLGFHNAIGHGATNGSITKELASGDKEGIGTGAFSIVERFAFIQPGGDAQMYLQSDDAQDNSAGTGAQEITITYFNFAWEKKTVAVVPNGVTQVTISVADIYRIHSVITNKGNAAAGNITITDVGETTLYGEIAIYKTYMERCIFYVATGETVSATSGIFGCTTSGGVQFVVAASEQDVSGNVVTRARIPFKMEAGILKSKFEHPESVSNPDGKRIAILVAVTAASGAPAQKGSAWLGGFTQSE